MKSILRNYLAVLILITQISLLAACDKLANVVPDKTVKQTSPKLFRNKDSRGRYDTIGKLGTHSISIPAGVIDGWARYVGAPGDFADPKIKSQYQRPEKTYDLPIESFGFNYRITDGDVLTSFRQTEEDYRNDSKTLIPQGKPFPWAGVIIYGIYDNSQALNFNDYLRESFKISKINSDINYIEQPDTLYGLTLYKANNGIDHETGEPWKSDTLSKDILIKKNHQAEIKTYISCQFTHSKNSCYHLFYNDDWHIRVYIRYNRIYLAQWQKFEHNIINILESWRVTKEGKLLGKQIGKA